MRLAGLEPIFLDCQTTGGSPRSGHLLELGFALGGEAPQSRLAKLPEPLVLPAHISRLTGITSEDLKDAYEPAAIFSELTATAKTNAVCVIHCAEFELRFLQPLAEAHGFDALPWPTLCTLQIAKRLFPDLPSRSIRALAGRFGMPLSSLKRAACHVEATRFIWGMLVPLLEEKGFATLQDVTEWLATEKPRRRQKLDFLITPERRLALPKSPGVYRYHDATNRVLYVGKATSLHSRVNSYFRGLKKRSTRLNEMLSQAHDFSFDTCDNEIEAALRESDLIKELDPPYNVQLKRGRRRAPLYADRQLQSLITPQSNSSCLGPFNAEAHVEQLQTLCLGVSDPNQLSSFFHVEVDVDLVRGEFDKILREVDLDPMTVNPRQLVWLGHLLRRNKQLEFDELSSSLASEELESDGEGVAGETAPATWSEEDVREALISHLVHAAIATYRAHWLRRLANCEFAWKKARRSPWQSIVMRGGALQAKDSSLAPPSFVLPSDLATYDRLRVLLAEIKICLNRCYDVRLDCAGYGLFDREGLARAAKRI